MEWVEHDAAGGSGAGVLAGDEVVKLEHPGGSARQHGRRDDAFWLSRVDGAQKRLLAAVRSLALARKMAAPDVCRALPSGRVPGEPRV